MLRATAALAAVFTLFAAPIAYAQPSATVPGAELELSVTDSSGFTYSADLECMPNGGTHSDPWSACRSLKDAKGDPDNLREQDWKVCTMQYDPVIFAVTGTWKGEEVAWSKSFGNLCTGHRMTNGIFDF